MKINYIKIGDIKHRPLMQGIELHFSEAEDSFINANCFIGINGSGKSQFLETIAEIFLFLDREFRTINIPKSENPDFTFEIEYFLVLEEKKVKVKISQQTLKSKDLSLEVFDSNNLEINILSIAKQFK